MANNKKEFKFLGYTFKPIKKLRKEFLESPEVFNYLSSDKELGFSTYDWWENKKDYSLSWKIILY